MNVVFFIDYYAIINLQEEQEHVRYISTGVHE